MTYAPSGFLLSSSQRIEVLDGLGIRYELGRARGQPGLVRLGRCGGGPALFWPDGDDGVFGWYRLGQIPLFTRVCSGVELERLLDQTGLSWRADLEIHDAGRRAVTSVRRADDGSVFLPFNPDRAARALLREAYSELASSMLGGKVKALARDGYYRLKPFLPPAAQMSLRRRFARAQERAAFPRWPTETGLHDLYDLMLMLVDEIAGEPVPRLASWPDEKSWALVLTHDVETRVGYGRVQAVLDIEHRFGLRSAWFLVPERDYRVTDAEVTRLVERGCEVGVHGLRHDGRDLSPGEFPRRLPAMRSWAQRWSAVGFRSPATHRRWDLMARLCFDYDSSYMDVAPYEPQPGGSCSWLPFFIGDLVELPITLPMDHTLFELLGHEDASLWAEKADFLRDRGGMALLLTHPDYLDGTRMLEYERFIEAFCSDESAWLALPHEVSAWWRQRAASQIVREGEGWKVVGPASGRARIQLGASTGGAMRILPQAE
jgi:peptidoglycan/xylan/chitin deacetylase (PgdA/CDA1 family)